MELIQEPEKSEDDQAERSVQPSEVVRLRDHLNRMVDELHRKLEKKEEEVQDKWRWEREQLIKVQEEMKKGLRTRQKCCQFQFVRIRHFLRGSLSGSVQTVPNRI